LAIFAIEQVWGLNKRVNPLSGITIPGVPVWREASAAPEKAENPAPSAPVANGKPAAPATAGKPGRPPRGKPGGGRGQGMGGAPALSPEAQARVDKIVDSEILGPVIRPMPMALMGIAGRSAILRSSTGQTGLVKEGDELGGLKVVRIGVNRVLVEEKGEQKELTLFDGLGGESLLPKPKENTK